MAGRYKKLRGMAAQLRAQAEQVARDAAGLTKQQSTALQVGRTHLDRAIAVLLVDPEQAIEELKAARLVFADLRGDLSGSTAAFQELIALLQQMNMSGDE